MVLDPKIDGDDTENPWVNLIVKLLNDYNIVITENIERYIADFKDNPAPASAKYHCNVRWGNWEHMLDFLDFALQRNSDLGSIYHALDIVEVVLSHDISKFLYPPEPNKTKDGKKFYKGKPWTYDNQNYVYLPHEVIGLVEGLKYFDLNDFQKQAILYHTGSYSYDIIFPPPLKNAHIETFTEFIHMCDNWSAKLIEEKYTSPLE